MTSSVENYNILNNAQINTDSVSAVTPVAKSETKDSSNFTQIFDKTVNSNNKTIGDIKGSLKQNDSFDKMKSFKEFLNDATNEAKVESSLDLTLARDINDIISQLKGAVENQETEDLDQIGEEITDVIPVVFDQALSLADKATELDNTDLSKDLLKKASEFLDNYTKEETITEDTEELAIKTDDKQVEETDRTSELNIDEDILNELNIESVKAETDNADSSSFMNKQSPEEHSAKIVIGNQIEKFEIPVNTTQTTQAQAQTNTNDVNPSRIIEQITKQLEHMNGSKVDIVLNPQSLGRINLHITNTQEGLSAQFTVSSNEIRDLLMKGLDGLKEALNTHGVGVDNITVKLNETEESSYNPDWTDKEGSRGGNKDQGQPNHKEKEKGLFEKTIANQFKKNDNV